MNNTLKLAGASLLALAMGALAHADTITSIMGTGIPAEGWVSNVSTPSDSPPVDQVKVALRARENYGAVLPLAGANPNIFLAQAGTSAGRALWNIDFSVNADLDGAALGDTNYLSNYIFKLTLTINGGPAIVVNPITFWSDNSYGDNSTGQGAGVEDNDPSSHVIAQNSQNAIFAWPGIDPYASGVYDFQLQADRLDGFPTPYAYTSLRVIVNGVPDGGATAILVGASLLGMGLITRRRKVA